MTIYKQQLQAHLNDLKATLQGLESDLQHALDQKDVAELRIKAVKEAIQLNIKAQEEE